MTHATSHSLPKPIQATSSALVRSAILAYGLVCYAVGMTGLFWLILTAQGLLPFQPGPISLSSTPAAIGLNLLVVAAFGIQHAIMARPAFKARWTTLIHPAMERSTFVFMAGGLMALAMWLWQPLESIVWSVDNGLLAGAIRTVGWLGWGYLVAASFAINHFELFGLTQVYRNLRQSEPCDLPLVMRWMYRFDRHPLMSGVLIGIWSTPVMRFDHLVLALGFTAYIILGVAIEERDLVRQHGDSYRTYRSRVRSIVPGLGLRN